MLTYLFVSKVIHGQDHGDVVALGQGLEPAPQVAHVRHLLVLPRAAGQQPAGVSRYNVTTVNIFSHLCESMTENQAGVVRLSSV